MKRMTTIVLAISMAAFSAQSSDSKPRRAKAPAGKPAKTLSLPPGAKLVEPNTWTFTDAQGKNWIYRKTPFGLSRLDADADDFAARKKPEKQVEITSVAISGDVAKFERPGPFGTYRWEKKLSDLSPEEQSAVEKLKTEKAAK